MSNRDDKDLQNIPEVDEEFDYLKEIEEIERQERELEEQRRKKREELDRLREAREKENEKNARKSQEKPRQEEEDRRAAARKRREKREQKKEAQWLGEDFTDSVELVDVPKKKKSKKGLVAAVIVILILACAGGGYTYKLQMDKKAVTEFEQKVASFQSEKLDAIDLGSHKSYFDDFFAQCQEAIEAGDLTKIAELDNQWAEMEQNYTTVSNGRTSLDAFAAGVDESLAAYSITEDYKETYDTLMADIAQAQKDCDYDQVSDLQKRLDSLATNLKADNMKLIQNLKNDIASIDLDENYTSDEQKKQLQQYSDQVNQYSEEENYAKAVEVLNSWKKQATSIGDTIAAKKAEEAAKAESEAAARRKAESEAAESRAIAQSKAAAESRAKAESESKAAANNSSSGSSSSGSSSVKGDYVLPNSSSAYLTASDVKNLSSYQLMIARNEIYARHGRKFVDSSIQAYFNSKSWYRGTVEPEDFSASVFNDYEIKNIELIQSYE